MPKYVIVVDTWEGHPEIVESTLMAAGVKMFLVRLNDMNGGHHMDKNFNEQWQQSASFLRLPYFVYNPWVSGKENLVWLANHVPDVKAVALDIEVKYSGITPDQYAAQVASFVAGVKTKWKPIIYTGGWFLSYLSSWPKDVDYWWGRYPGWVYPAEKTPVTWEWLAGRVNGLTWAPDAGVKTPHGPVKLWQCTADRYILPGCGPSPIDINVWPGTLEELQAWVEQPAPVALDWQHSLDAWARTQGYAGPGPEN